jgi:hypothetical protein
MARTSLLRIPSRTGMRGLGDGCQWIQTPSGPAWAQYVGTQGGYVGCGVPPTPPPVVGTGPVSSILNEYQQVIADNPYLNSPAYLAAEAAAGAPDPGARQDAINTLIGYCQQNAFNNGIWGTPLDTITCNGNVPLPGMLAQLNSIVTPPYYSVVAGGGSGTQGGGQSVATVQKTQPASPPPVGTNVANSQTNAGNNASPDLINGQPTIGAKLSADFTAVESWIQTNWMLVAAGLAAVFILPHLMGGRR